MPFVPLYEVLMWILFVKTVITLKHLTNQEGGKKISPGALHGTPFCRRVHWALAEFVFIYLRR